MGSRTIKLTAATMLGLCWCLSTDAGLFAQRFNINRPQPFRGAVVNPRPNVNPRLNRGANQAVNRPANPGLNQGLNPGLNQAFNPNFNQGFNPAFNPNFNQGFNPAFNPNFNQGFNPAFNPNFNQGFGANNPFDPRFGGLNGWNNINAFGANPYFGGYQYPFNNPFYYNSPIVSQYAYYGGNPLWFAQNPWAYQQLAAGFQQVNPFVPWRPLDNPNYPNLPNQVPPGLNGVPRPNNGVNVNGLLNR